MVPDISTGARTYGLLSYLYGPGRRDEHVDPHLVGAWMPELAPDPGRDPSATLKQLADRLDLPVRALSPGQQPKRHVWHCPVRTAPGDRTLADAEWDRVARRIVAATGIAPEGDDKACRWVAVRHAVDHIHIVATLVRQDGRRPRRHREATRAQAECRTIEAELGLRVLNQGDGTAAQRPTSAERAKAERHGRPEAARETLREAVRHAVAGAATEEEFFTRLADAGLRIKKRVAPSGDATGYSVALPGDRNRAGEPIWFSGSTLAPDLSLPKIRHRLADGDDQSRPHTSASQPNRPRPAQARRHATAAADHVTNAFHHDHDESVAAQLSGVGELLDAIAHTTPGATRTQLREAARAFERATRWHQRTEQASNHALRSAARGIIQVGAPLGRDEDGAATAMLLSSLILIAIATAHWHAARGHAQQAEAARRATHHLRTAYSATAATPLRTMQQRGQRLPTPVRNRHTSTIRTVLPEYADRIHAEPGRHALTATLNDAERSGLNPATLLRQAAAIRELESADSISEVMVWRLRRLAALPTAGTRPRPHTNHPHRRHATDDRPLHPNAPEQPTRFQRR